MSSHCDVAIIGAGPYGLSVAAHLRSSGIRFRIFGRPMFTWKEQMPQGMALKSDGFASNLSDPKNLCTLESFCRQKNVPYDHTRIPISLDTFIAYGEHFQKMLVPDLEETLVTQIEKQQECFHLTLENGDIATARAIVLAIGINYFQYIPEVLTHLPAKHLSHSAAHKYPDQLRGNDVTIIGGGASAMDLAALMHESGVNVTLIARRSSLKFHAPPGARPASLWNKVRWPQTGIGPGWKSRFFTDAPLAFHFLPEEMRIRIVRRYLGPSGGWPLRNRVVGHVPLKLGQEIECAEVRDDKVALTLKDEDGATEIYMTDHIIAATGYRVDLSRLPFLSKNLYSSIKSIENTPVLSARFESSVPGLYFVGVSSANSFGPVMRFAYGAEYAARRISRHLARQVEGHAEQPWLAPAEN